jgi:hypothetical protein
MMLTKHDSQCMVEILQRWLQLHPRNTCGALIQSQPFL